MNTVMIPHYLTPEDEAVLSSLRDRGFSVCVFTPDELEAAEPEEVEYFICEAGWRKIAFDNRSEEPEEPNNVK